MNKLTQEQQKVVDTVLSATDERIIAVNSIAGSGKTSTASAVINAYKPKNGFYTAFNKAIVTDSSKRFGKLLDCKTIHALAYSHIKPSKGIEDLTYLSIKEPISYETKAKVIEIIDDFYRSSSLDINTFSASRTNNEDIQQLVFEYTNKMLEGKIPVTFNYMLKCLHLMLAHKEIEIDYDLLILDECLTEDMLITTSTGERTIKSIVNSLLRNEKVLVKSFNQNSKEFEFKEASNPLISHNRDVIEIRTEGLNKIKCTPNHKIFTQRGYVKAEDLVIGKDFVLLDNPNNQKTLNPFSNEYENYGSSPVASKKYIGKQTVYDFEVEDNHNFVTSKSKSKNSSKIIVHNCQDTTAVTLEIFKLINAKHKVMFGDKYQNIYSFMNTVNAFDELDNINLLRLTKSFRCNPEIAGIVDEYGKYYLEDNFVFKGNEDIEQESQFKVAYITRTNAMLIERMFHLMNEGQSFTLTRNPNEIFALPIAMLNAANGKEVYDKKYKFLEKEYKNFDKVRRSYRSFYEYINSIMEDPLIEMVTKVLGNFANKRINIYDVKAKVLALKPNPNIVLTTAHAFKGLEMDNVYIEEDLNSSVNRTIQRMKNLSTIVDGNPRLYLSKEQKEDLNTYYVALSRAKTNITNVKYLS